MKIFTKFSTLFFILFIFSNFTIAQISVDIKPVSNYVTLQKNVPSKTMPSFDVKKLLAEDNFEAQFKDIPPRFGNPMDVNFGYSNSGVIETLPDGTRIWRLEIVSTGAISINMIFDRFYLPKGSTFYVYNKQKTFMIGAFTSDNNRPERIFSTQPVLGDDIILEYNAPYTVTEKPEINISTVVHAYKNIFNFLKKKDYGGSGACNRNVICPEGDPYRDQIRSGVLLLTSSNSRFCSGSMVNNTRFDGTPFMLTANHCWSSSQPTWIVMFNYQAPSCPNPGGDGPLTYTISGTTLCAKNSFSDFCLVKLSSKPPANYNVYYSGWNNSNVPATGGFCIHHPDCDVKKISFSTTPYTPTSYNNPSVPGDSSHWHVIWALLSSTGDTPITEPGSSGSPIYNQNKQIVGQLHGGPSSCTATDKSDYYGKFDRSWRYGSTPDTRLKDWLDSANTGVTFIGGYDPNSGPLNAFNLQTPAAGVTITSIAGSSTITTFNWDTASAGATYKWIFGTSLPTRQLTIPVNVRPLNMTLGQLDTYLAGIGVAQGDSISGSWDAWAFRNNPPANDSLKATNGPRTIKFKRYKPTLTAFNLNSPPNNARVEGLAGGTTPFVFKWTKTGAGALYKVFYASPNFSSPANIKFRLTADNGGYDSLYSTTNGAIDALLQSIGVGAGDSTVGQWRVYAYSGADSLASAQTFNITFKRLPIGNIIIGNGTSALQYPYYTYWHDARTQIIYSSWEIAAGGGGGHVITGIGFNVVALGGQPMQSFQVRMKHTTDSTLAAFDESTTGWSTVYTNASYIPAGTGWQMINLTTPFAFNPGYNLLIELCFNNGSYTTSTTVNGTPMVAGVQKTYERHMDNAPSGGCLLTVSQGSTTTNPARPNITLVMNLALGENNNILDVPKVYSLSQNYPNPFNPSTKIRYELPKDGFVTLKVYDMLGREITTLVNEIKREGSYMIDFDGSSLASGTYFFKITVNDFVNIKKMILLK